jgi:hypothetical protein
MTFLDTYKPLREEYEGHLREFDRLIKIAGNTQYAQDLHEEKADFSRDTKLDIDIPLEKLKIEKDPEVIKFKSRIILNDMQATNEDMFEFLHKTRSKLDVFRKSKKGNKLKRCTCKK